MKKLKKLKLEKTVISNLQNEEMRVLKGGVNTWETNCDTCNGSCDGTCAYTCGDQATCGEYTCNITYKILK